MGWKDELEDGAKEMQADGMSVLIQWRGYDIPAFEGTGVSFEMLANGGPVSSENPSFTVLKSDLARIAGGQTFAQDDEIKCGSKTVAIKTISSKSNSPVIRLETHGDEQ